MNSPLTTICLAHAWCGSLPAESRSPGWSTLRAAWLAEHPTCECCGTGQGLTAHHVVPVHVEPAREMDRRNLLTLCEPCHWLVGHLCSWKSWNDKVVYDAKRWRNKIERRP